MEHNTHPAGFLEIVCAWCSKHLRWEREDPDFVSPYGKVSHTICPPCVAQVWQDVEESE
jgi:hypothetical protein